MLQIFQGCVLQGTYRTIPGVLKTGYLTFRCVFHSSTFRSLPSLRSVLPCAKTAKAFSLRSASPASQRPTPSPSAYPALQRSKRFFLELSQRSKLSPSRLSIPNRNVQRNFSLSSVTKSKAFSRQACLPRNATFKAFSPRAQSTALHGDVHKASFISFFTHCSFRRRRSLSSVRTILKIYLYYIYYRVRKHIE